MNLNNVKAKFGNCILYAIPKFITEGGYVIISWSPRNRYIPHFSWSGDLSEVEGFVPVAPKQGLLGVLTSPFFRGFWKKESLETFKSKTKL